MKNYFNELWKLTENSYSPYSQFQVASIILTKDGKEYKGINIENASFGATTCAERAAISNALTDGVSGNEIIEIHLLGKPTAAKKDEIPFTSPCGICRQVISEIVNDDVKVVIYQGEDKFKELSKAELLPYAFTGEEMDYD